MLSAANKELYPGCVKYSQLSFTARLMSMKSNHRVTDSLFDELSDFFSDVLLDNNIVPKDFYSTKKVMKRLGLPFERIHSCRNHCIIFWESDEHLTQCKFCRANRYKDPSRHDSNKKKERSCPQQDVLFPHHAPPTKVVRITCNCCGNALARNKLGRWDHASPCKLTSMETS